MISGRLAVRLFFVTLCSVLRLSALQVGTPKIACRNPVYNFGTAVNTGKIEHTFLIWNDGNAPLEIGNLRACCGASMKMEGKAIAPGTNAEATVIFSLRGRRGRQRKSFYIASNDRARPYLQLRLQGTAVAKEGPAPLSVDFGQISPECAEEKQVKVNCGSGSAFSITGLVSTAAQFSATHGDARTNNVHAITVSSVPPLPLGKVRGKILVLTDSKKCPEIEILASADVTSDLTFVPSEIVLLNQPGIPKPVTRYAAVRSLSGKPFKILKVKPPQPDIKTDIHSITPSVWRLTFSNITPSEDLDGCSVLITTDHSTTKEIAIPLRVVAEEPAE